MNKKDIYQIIDNMIDEYYSKTMKTLWHNAFHIEMPFGLINDPNGLSYFNQKYYLFYQWNPFGCIHDNKHWGLITTSDFIHYSKPKIALKPINEYDRDGCFSGTALVKEDQLWLYYTGNVMDEGIRHAYQCLATCTKDNQITKQGVIIPQQPDGYTSHFRDPFIFQNDDNYYLALGAQTTNREGKILLYQSKDAKQWSYLDELKTSLEHFGYMWECPNLIKLNEDQYALIFSPQGIEQVDFKYQNIYQSGYIIGKLNLNNVSLENHSEFKELDMGFDFYAPQVFHDGKQWILFGWVGMSDKLDEYPTNEEGWVHSLTLPRVLEYKDGMLYQHVHENIKQLRNNKFIEISGLCCRNYQFTLNSRSSEIELDLEIGNNSDINIEFKFGYESIRLYYQKEINLFTIDRTNMQQGGKGIRKFILKSDSILKLHMYIDQSIMEIYYQDGKVVTTLAYFPINNRMEIELSSDDYFEISQLSVYHLKKLSYE